MRLGGTPSRRPPAAHGVMSSAEGFVGLRRSGAIDGSAGELEPDAHDHQGHSGNQHGRHAGCAGGRDPGSDRRSGSERPREPRCTSRRWPMRTTWTNPSITSAACSGLRSLRPLSDKRLTPLVARRPPRKQRRSASTREASSGRTGSVPGLGATPARALLPSVSSCSVAMSARCPGAGTVGWCLRMT